MTSDDKTHPDFEFVEIYISYNFAEVEFLRDMLEDNTIQCTVRNLAPSQFPLDVGKHGQIRIAVEDGQVNEAKALIQQAIDDNAISSEGNFID